MTVSLRKGQGVSLRKNEFDLSSVTIGLGWDINEEKKGFLGGIFGKKEEEYDLDVIAFLCNAASGPTCTGQSTSGATRSISTCRRPAAPRQRSGSWARPCEA